ncbi:hypothetical protein [Tolumonas osonensis]|uniref:Uncharacterized protein n=1 Tax=Tolumonas osonensis TaxID=675874 RepID=A0A841GN77_9GAMM|nr:hypothetical protein [Tolumonas osonensis]MBB6055922.1 hypothetical protein [Tolumonas osonensis]
MIIKIKPIDLNSLEMDEKIISSIDNILKSFGEKKHIILAEKAFFSFIIDRADLFGVNSRRYANAALNQQRELNALTKIVNFYVEVDFSLNKFNNFDISNDDRNILTISADYFSDTKLIQSASIICEDINDIDLYELFSNYFVEQARLNHLSTSFNKVNGGGANTSKVFDKTSDDGVIGLCIVDSDKSHPLGARGSTSKKLGTTKYKNRCRLVIINAHEAESLIPVHIIDEIIHRDTYENHVIDSFDTMKNIFSASLNTKLYFDHKEGFKLKDAITLDSSYGPFWVPALKSTKKFDHLRCVNERACGEDCSCVSFYGLGDTLLEKSLVILKKNKMSSVATKTSESLVMEWLSLGKLFFSWFCAPPTKVRQ